MDYKTVSCPLFVQVDDPEDPRRHSITVVESLLMGSIKPPTADCNLLINKESLATLYTVQEQALRLATRRYDMWLPQNPGEDAYRAGFLLADGPGLGKSRVIASLIHDNWLNGRKRAVWITVSRDLLASCRETLKDVHCPSDLKILPSWNLIQRYYRHYEKSSNIVLPEGLEGVLFMTYVSLVSEGKGRRKKVSSSCSSSEDDSSDSSSASSGDGKRKRGVTTSKRSLDLAKKGSPASKKRTKTDDTFSQMDSASFKLLLAWLRPNFDGLIVFDECHKLKNAFNSEKSKQSEVGKLLCKLQDIYPGARILYSSATAAIEPVHFAYMPRLGVWGPGMPFISRDDFISRSNKAKLTEIETLVCSLKKSGACLSRQLSLQDVTVRIHHANISPGLQETYDECSEWWKDVLDLYTTVLRCSDYNGLMRRNKLGVFWSACLNFFRNFCLCSKIYPIRDLTEQILRNDQMCVIIGLQTTGEAALRSTKLLGPSFVDQITTSTCKYIMQRIINTHIRQILDDLTGAENCEEVDSNEDIDEGLHRSLSWTGNGTELIDDYEVDTGELDESGDKYNSKDVQGFEAKRVELEKKATLLYEKLPGNFIDMLRYIFKEKGINVAEMTGRVLQLDIKNEMANQPSTSSTSSSTIARRGHRKGGKSLNELEREKFMSGKARVLIISEAASTGLDLQATAAPGNHRQRAHITVELNWSVDRLIQQAGRSNRGNQTSAPIYYMMYANLPGELRFSSNVAKKLSLMGASVQGDRRANNQRMFVQFDCDNELGKLSLRYMQMTFDFEESRPRNVPIPTYNGGDYLEEATRELSRVGIDVETLGRISVAKFLNRLLVCRVEIAQLMLGHFEAIFEELQKAKQSSNDSDFGIEELIFYQERSKIFRVQKLVRKDGRPTECWIYEIEATSGVLIKDICKEPDEKVDTHEGWYRQKEDIKNAKFIRYKVCMVQRVGSLSTEEKKYGVISPYYFKTVNEQELLKLLDGYVKTTRRHVERDWNKLSDFLNPNENFKRNRCIHAYSYSLCDNETTCRKGIRRCSVKLVTGNLYSIMDTLKAAFLDEFGDTKRLKLTRIKLDETLEYVFGVIIPEVLMNEVFLKTFNLVDSLK